MKVFPPGKTCEKNCPHEFFYCFSILRCEGKNPERTWEFFCHFYDRIVQEEKPDSEYVLAFSN